MFTRSFHISVAFCFAITRSIAANVPKFIDYSLAKLSLKRKREERWFVDFKIILVLHCGNEFRMEVCSFRFKFDHMVSR